jgi:starch synthase
MATNAVLLIASEGLPFTKTGGLADVIGALPPALARLGWQTTVVMPQYRAVSGGTLLARDKFTLGGQEYAVGFHEHPLASGARAILLECPELFDRAGIYGDQGNEYSDNPLRFALLSLAALEFAVQYGPRPAIVHAHDWQAGLAPVYLRSGSAQLRSNLATTSTVFTVHNLAYQGIFDADWLPRLDLPWEQFDVEAMEFWGRISFLKGGIVNSDKITTVSPSYSREIQTPTLGFGFDGVLRKRAADIEGILNGIDADEWNPLKDRFLPEPFGPSDLAGKRASKRALLTHYRLATDDAAMARPVLGIVSRMVSQKGFDLLEEAAKDLLGIDATFVVLGTGEARYESFWKQMATDHPDRVGVQIGFDERLAHLIEAGADAFLMPSQFEPCGLNQMSSMRYGTLPIVRAVGGLADSVDASVGFRFHEYSVDALLAVLREARRVYSDEPQRWASMIQLAMTRDYSWDRAAQEYSRLYERAIAKRHPA